MGVKDYSTNPDNNTTISGINIAEGCPPSGINNAIRQLMADMKENDDEHTVMTGATASAAGKFGYVPAPKAGDQDKPLAGSGKFVEWLECSVTGSSQFLRKDDKNKISYEELFEKFLQVAGGTVNGGIILNGTLALQTGIIQSVLSDAKEFSIVASTGGASGGILSLRPLDSTENAGGFYLGAVNQQTSKYLRGDTSGSLTWGGNRVISGEDCVVISQKSDGFTLPAGGTWRYIFVTVVAGVTPDVDAGAGQAAGGTYIRTKTGGYVHVLCVRIA